MFPVVYSCSCVCPYSTDMSNPLSLVHPGVFWTPRLRENFPWRPHHILPTKLYLLFTISPKSSPLFTALTWEHNIASLIAHNASCADVANFWSRACRRMLAEPPLHTDSIDQEEISSCVAISAVTVCFFFPSLYRMTYQLLHSVEHSVHIQVVFPGKIDLPTSQSTNQSSQGLGLWLVNGRSGQNVTAFNVWRSGMNARKLYTSVIRYHQCPDYILCCTCVFKSEMHKALKHIMDIETLLRFWWAAYSIPYTRV